MAVMVMPVVKMWLKTNLYSSIQTMQADTHMVATR